MSERNWTPAQLSAITADSKSVLVSAAAGSGKTAVLTERIIRKLTDPDHPADLSRVLIVTFTKAAASELRQRISGALSEKISEHPDNKQLFRQYASLNGAKISTIDSFCYDLVKTNFEKLGLHPKVRLIDEKQDQLLSDEVISAVLEEYYAESEEIKPDEMIPHFAAFADNFTIMRDDRMLEAFQKLYRSLSVLPEGIVFLKDASEHYRIVASADFTKTIWGQTALNEITRVMQYYQTQTERALLYFSEDPYLNEKNAEAFQYQEEYISKILLSVKKQDYLNLQAVFNDYHTPRILPMKAEMKTEMCEVYRDMRTRFGKAVVELNTRYFLNDAEELSETAARLAELTANLYSFLLRYERRINYEKQRRGILNYSDLERYAYQLLYRADGSISDEALDISTKYDEIYIDEYQDVNELQDKIFTALAVSASRFMVGDIKQSIYSFRGAEPKLFAGYRASDQILSVFLQTNFRCSRQIIDFSNTVFQYLFSHNENRMPYTSEDALVCGKESGSENKQVTLALIEGEADRNEFTSKEADWVAEKILTLHKEGYKYGDISILLRSTNGSSVYYENALTKRGIPFYSQISHDFFENAEVLLMLSLINCIDNPTRDVYLAAILKSPIFGFTLDDLIHIRTGKTDYTLYDSLKEYCKANPEFTKGKLFLEKLNSYRKTAVSMPVDRLIWYLYQDTGILSMVYDNRHSEQADGAEKRANLMLLYDYARNFENGSFKGLYPFIRYLNEILSSGTKLETAKTVSESADTVKIMTIHKSKGLEFPVCFVSDAGRNVNHSETGDLISCDRVMGPAFKLADDTGFAQIDSPYRRATLRVIADENISEEMRILYVALTRAKNLLFVTGLVKEGAEERLRTCKGLAETSISGSNYALLSKPDYISWILISLASSGYRDYQLITADETSDSVPSCEGMVDHSAGNAEQSMKEEQTEECYRILEKRFSYVYPHEAAMNIPAKVSVSELKPSLLDEDPDTFILPTEQPTTKLKKPAFLEPAPDSATAAERGIATHLFMQFCDFSFIEKYGVEEEIKRLVASSFISSETAALIHIKHIKRFFTSELYQQMRSSVQLFRETRFNVTMPASSFTTDPDQKSLLANEEMLVQGVIDCFFESPDGNITVVDYKTDSIPYELNTQQAIDEYIISRHAAQINYYRQAIRQLICKDCSDAFIYVFSIGRTVKIPDNTN